jgi:hypothetical protein
MLRVIIGGGGTNPRLTCPARGCNAFNRLQAGGSDERLQRSDPGSDRSLPDGQQGRSSAS